MQKIKIAGKATIAITKQNTINVGDTEGHIISMSEFEGTNVSTGKNKFLDGAQVSGMGFADLVMGNGPYQDYGKYALNGDVVFCKGQAKAATTLSSQGKPVTIYEGKLSFTKGTGKYENIQGGWTYKCKLISRTIAICEWEGEYFIKK